MRSGETNTLGLLPPAQRNARSSGSREAPTPLPTTETCASSSIAAKVSSSLRSATSPWTFSVDTSARSSHISRGHAECACSASRSRCPFPCTRRTSSSAMPLMRSSRETAFFTSVPGPGANVLRAWRVMPRSRANSTAWALSTFAPASASCCISSCDSSASRLVEETRRGSAV